MAEYLGIKVVKKEGTENIFEVTLKKESPLIIISNYRGISIEDQILLILSDAQRNIHEQVMKITY